MCVRFFAVIAAVVVLTAVACGSSHDGPQAPSATNNISTTPAATATAAGPTVTPHLMPTAVQLGMYPRGKRTNNPVVDRFLDIYESGNVESLNAMVQYAPLKCVATLSHFAPQCPEGTPLGSLVPSVRLDGCEGGIRSEEFIEEMLRGHVRDTVLLYGAYKTTPDAEEVVVLMGQSPADDKSPWRVILGANGLMPKVEVGCGGYNVPMEGVTWILAPLG